MHAPLPYLSPINRRFSLGGLHNLAGIYHPLIAEHISVRRQAGSGVSDRLSLCVNGFSRSGSHGVGCSAARKQRRQQDKRKVMAF